MASINDVFNRLGIVNDTLSWIYKELGTVNTSVNSVDSDVKAGTTATVNALTTLTNDVTSGFSAVVNALTVIAEINEAEATLLFHLTQQADTMICALQQISKNTCGILTQVTAQTQLQTELRADTGAILDIEETAHPEASLERQRLAGLRARIDKCCPPPPPQPACTYQPCPAPDPVKMPQLPQLPVVGRGANLS
jgi:hypothetical protein